MNMTTKERSRPISINGDVSCYGIVDYFTHLTNVFPNCQVYNTKTRKRLHS